MKQILCSTGAFLGRPNGRDYRLLEVYVPQLACDGIEFIMYDSWYGEIDELTGYLKKLKLNIPVLHCEKKLTEGITRGGREETAEAYRLFEINCRLAGEIGARKTVIHLWNGPISDTAIDNNVRAFGDLREIAGRYGTDLLVENVVCHLQDPMTHWCRLKEVYPDIHFIFDTKMADFHRQLDLLYAPEYRWLTEEGHIRHYHVNDYGGGYKDWNNLKVLAPGEGHIDFERFTAFVKSTGYRDTFTFEATALDQHGTVGIERLNRQFEWAKRML
ncbi:MAG: sugar phosphate isomerase/epimerase [Clostridia bacterium]|nr:sugar phosphate isomerase/epimerase [Clostridia bacterium]